MTQASLMIWGGAQTMEATRVNASWAPNVDTRAMALWMGGRWAGVNARSAQAGHQPSARPHTLPSPHTRHEAAPSLSSIMAVLCVVRAMCMCGRGTATQARTPGRRELLVPKRT